MPEPMAVEETAPAIDEDMQSRQMAVYGRESMQKLRKANVLISGLNGLGAEIAKNTILANVMAVTLHDSQTVTPADCGSNFYLSPADAGKNRAEACVQQMQELNPGVAVSTAKGAFPTDLSAFTAVVAIDLSLDEALRADAACRAASPPIAFIRADVRGLAAGVFVDLGEQFTCADPTGESIKSAIVEHIVVVEEKDGTTKLRVQTVDDEDLDLDDGEVVTFSEVKGMEGLNAAGPLAVSDVSKGKKNFVVSVPQPASALGAYTTGGLVSEVRQPKSLAFKSLHDFLLAPGDLWEIDESKMAPAATSFSEEFLGVMGSPAANVCYGRSGLLHLGFRALDEYRKTHGGSLPPPANEAEAAAVLALAEALNGAADAGNKAAQLDEASRKTVLLQLAAGASATLSPMAAIVGGIVGQEIVKACTAKFHPICQGFYFDAFDCLPTDDLPIEEFSPAARGADTGRYDAQVSVFGATFQAKLKELNVFLVGSGALGCEFLKGLALMGVACGGDGDATTTKGHLTCTDDDVIEKSNLTRQFLFRNHNVGKSKSLSAIDAVRVINPALHATPLQDRVAPTTEHVFDTPFWRQLDVVVNALDNVKARLYVDERCVAFGKPLFESGTLGTKCNTQMVLPHETENYGFSRDPPEKEAPQCAVHNFPHNIDQCLVLAQSEFVGNFDTVPRETADFLAKGAAWVDALKKANESANSILDKLRGDQRVLCGMSGGARDLLIAERSTEWAQCVGWGRRKFESYFRHRVEQLLYNFPPDATTSQGVPFWSPPKRLPTPIAFDASDPLHMQFVMAAANLRAFTLGIATPPDCRDAAAIATLLASGGAAVAVQTFTPALDASIETDNKEEDAKRKAAAAAAAKPEEEQIGEALAELLGAAGGLPAGFALKPNEFEKDDDLNFHMDFISAFGNLRARNYGIEAIDKFQAKLKAGRIIPAIATTTAMATGFVCLELYKHVAQRPFAARRNLFANLALPGPLLMLSEPMPCPKIKSGSRWDPEMYMDVDEVAYPEGHTLWDQLVVPGGRSMTLAGLKAHFKSAHNLVLTEIGFATKVNGADGMAMVSADGDLAAKLLTDIVAEKTGKTFAPTDTFLPLPNIFLTTADGDDVKCAKVVVQLD